MSPISLVVGQAGTGKTTWLMKKAMELAPRFLVTDHRRLLAITRMHGARRRLESKLRESRRGIFCSVATIDGFALSIVNRWRTALGYDRPIQAVPKDTNFVGTVFGIEADFDRVMQTATTLLSRPTVGNIIGETYPLILIDEFQDCHGPLLEFVKALAGCSSILLAADDFQSLDTTVDGCRALEWVCDLQDQGAAEIIELTDCKRTSEQGILRAAECLRNNVEADGPTIPVFWCQNAGPAAWKIVETLVFKELRGTRSETTALICPSHDPVLRKVLDSCCSQLQKRNRAPLRWHEECNAEEERRQIRTKLGLATGDIAEDCEWGGPCGDIAGIENHVTMRVQQFARLKGLKTVPVGVVERHVEKTIHEKRAYCSTSQSKIVTTVHGAKNREFDNVFILWPYKLPPDPEQQRRLLYNAVTRSKRNCIVLALGDEKRAAEDPVLKLLGPAQPVFAQSKKPKGDSTKKRKPRVKTQ